MPGGAGSVLSLQHPLEGPGALLRGHSRLPQELLYCYLQRVQGAETLEGIRRDLCYLVVAQVSARRAEEGVAEFLRVHKALPDLLYLPGTWEGRGFFAIRKGRGSFSHPSEKPTATISLCSPRSAQAGHSSLGLFLTNFYPASQLSPTPPLSSTMAPTGAQAEMGG